MKSITRLGSALLCSILVCSTSCVFLFAKPAGATEDLHDWLELSWRAPSQCPEAGDVWSALERLSARDKQPPSRRLLMSGHVEKDSSGSYVLSLSVHHVTQGRRELLAQRTLSSADCADFADAASLVALLWLSTAEPEGAPEDSAPPAPTNPPAPKRQPADHYHLGASTQLGWVMTHSPSPGATLAAGWRGSSGFGLELAGSAWASSNTQLEPGLYLDLSAYSGAARACYRTGEEGFVARSCLGPELGVIEARSLGTPADGQVTAPWYGLGGSLELLVGLTSRVRLVATGRLNYVFTPPAFALHAASAGTRYSVPRFAPSAAFGVEVDVQ